MKVFKGKQLQQTSSMRKLFSTKMASAFEGSGNSEDSVCSDDAHQVLNYFIETHPFPQSVSVTGGSFMSRNVTITRGDVLLLCRRAPTSITLSFDDDSCTKQECTVSPDIPAQFLVLPPKDSVQADSESRHTKVGSGRPLSMVTYPTVADLLLDCPTYFEANSTYDDPYLPGFSVKPGDRFYYVKVVRDAAADKLERLQCRTESGELVCLSTRCRGNFTVLLDDTPYTLRQLIDLAKVPRRLKLLSPNDDLIKQEEELDTEAKIPEKLLSCTGVITMSCPQEMIEVSPWDNQQTTWSVPVDSNLHVRLFSDTDYEEPVTNLRIKPEAMSAFVHEHEEKFPVQATLISYIKPPDLISQNLSSSREIIIHEKLNTQKLFVKDTKKDDFFAIDESAQISFVQIPRALSSVFEMVTLPLGSQVRVLADVAADFPEPFILRYGDVLCVTKHDSSSWKFKHSSTGDVPIVKCERLVQGKKSEKLKLPLDLEVNLVLIEDLSQYKVTKLSDILSGEDQIPGGDVSVVEGNGASYPPLPASLQILEVLTDTELLVSPLRTTSAISPLIKTCVRIPVRHKVTLGLKRKLEFPDGYFVLPSKHNTVSLGIESVSESEFEELVQARKVATDYEEMTFSGPRESEDDTRSQASSMGRSRCAVLQEPIPRSASSCTLERRRHKDKMKRISQVMNPKNWHWSRRKEAEEDSPRDPPVSGLLTLALQPSRAVDNAYAEDCTHKAERAPLPGVCQATEPESPPDDTYEDVELTSPPDHDRANRSHPALVGAPSSDSTKSDGQRKERDRSDHDARRQRRRKSDPGLSMLVQPEQPTRNLLSRERRAKSPERCRDVEPKDYHLERAPKHHSRTKSPEFSEDSCSNSGRMAFEGKQHNRSHSSDRRREIPKGRLTGQEKHEFHDKSERSESGRPDHPRNLESREAHRKPRLFHSDHPKESRSTDVDNSKKLRSHESDHQPRKTKSPASDQPRSSRPRDFDKSRKPRSPSDKLSELSPKPGSADSNPDRKTGGNDPFRIKPMSPEFDQHSSCSNSRQPHPSSPPEKSKLDSCVKGPENVRSPFDRPERREQEGKQRGKTSPLVDRLQAQSPKESGKPRSPRPERKTVQSEATPRAQVSPETSVVEDCPQRPRRPHRKKDEEVGSMSVDSVEDSSKAPGTLRRDKEARVKPAIPPKPVLSPGPRASESPRKPPKPTVPPRKRAARIGSTEAEPFGGGGPSKPVLGRKQQIAEQN